MWSQTQDAAATTQVVADVISQNGITIGPEIQLDISFPAYDEVTVELTDNDPQVLLAGVVGIGSDGLARSATARHLLCDAGCFRSLDVTPPLGPIQASGSGDGFVPISVGNKVYVVNHHGSTIQCIDRATANVCWPAQQLFSTPTHTMNTAHAELIDDRIYYLAWNGNVGANPTPDGWLQLGCWNTTIDARCANQVDLFNVGHGTLYASGGNLYVFASNRNVYCYEAHTLNECPDYLGGRQTALSSEPGWGDWFESRAYNADRLGHDDKVFVTLSNRGEVWLHCWDLAANAPCITFGPRLLNGTRTGTTDDVTNGRLFLWRDGGGTPVSICSQGVAPIVDCFRLDSGADDTIAEGSMTATLSAVTMTSGEFVGVSTYHPGFNRQYFVSTFLTSTTHCHDFSTGSPCGVEVNDSAFGLARTYGYEVQDDCLLGYGDASVLFTLKPDMSGPCDTAFSTIDITGCQCSGRNVWPPVQVGDSEGVQTFEFRVRNPSGAVVFPADGSWLALTDEPVELEAIDNAYAYLTLEVQITQLPSQDPWADCVPPGLLVGMNNTDPHLGE